MESAFTPEGLTWQRLAPRAATARAVGAAVSNLVLVVILVAAAWWFPGWWAPLAAAIIGLSWLTWRVVRGWRWTRAFGYAEREHDLVIRTGLWNRRLSVIPYSRMQAVQVHSGPIDRLWGLAKVSLVTASVESHAAIPGLSAADATTLRDRLIRAGESQALPL
ncbi:MAG: PH domain-containing protein [Propionicimonas sp.]|uniref:PH domain-containing protein n=1 Tax=Propionicimonas sp. TaxID=1955623 RepID=UPI002B1EFD57|nr:PH domain-containing protein [Propionicimonas sp.]MEA4945309.1 PH domain-containing protein [Propionicimonas sp.]